MSYHNDLFPINIAYGARGGPMFNTTVLELASGFERRNINWSKARGRWNVMHGVKTSSDMDALVNFFYARYGRGYSFPYFDHKDHKIENQILGTGDDTTTSFQLYKRYTSGIYTYDRLITKIKPGTLTTVTVDDVPCILDDAGPNGFTFNELTGIFTFNTAPPLGDSIVIDYLEFYVHARFDSDYQDIQLVTYNAETWADIFIVEVKE